ncbi:MAG: DUF6807 family protein [Thermogutta sp.]
MGGLHEPFRGDRGSEWGDNYGRPHSPRLPAHWLTRHYGPLCIGWPGIQSRTLEPGSSTRLSYRLWIHSDLPTATEIQRIYDLYATIVHVKCKSSNER